MSDAPRRRLGDLGPDPELWAALDDGRGLTAVLTDFYQRVYSDPRLAPFFEGTTRQRAIEKQYAFLKEIFTGEKVYFGDRPSNAHHWMVISDELFDYREEMMASCLRRHGLAEPLVARWRRIEEIFRKVIVKPAPRGRRIHGVELPVEGYERVVIAGGSLCDGCGSAMDAGTEALYHVRTGRAFCSACHPLGGDPEPGPGAAADA